MSEPSFLALEKYVGEMLEYPPTNECGICGFKENPKSRLVRTEFWLCNDCRDKIKKLLREDEDE